MGRYSTCNPEELELHIYMARERLQIAEALQVSIGMTDHVVVLCQDLRKLIRSLQYDLHLAEEAMWQSNQTSEGSDG